MLEQIETTFQFLARELITSNEINERAPEATRLLCNEPLDWRKNCAKLVAAGLPVEIRPLDGATKISQEKLTVHLEPFGEGLFKTLSRVEPKRAPVFAATYVEDLADVGHGISWRPNEPTTYPPELDEPKVILTDELALACHGDVGRVLPSITDGAPTEEAVLLLTALVMELSGYMLSLIHI